MLLHGLQGSSAIRRVSYCKVRHACLPAVGMQSWTPNVGGQDAVEMQSAMHHVNVMLTLLRSARLDRRAPHGVSRAAGAHPRAHAGGGCGRQRRRARPQLRGGDSGVSPKSQYEIKGMLFLPDPHTSPQLPPAHDMDRVWHIELRCVCFLKAKHGALVSQVSRFQSIHVAHEPYLHAGTWCRSSPATWRACTLTSTSSAWRP